MLAKAVQQLEPRLRVFVYIACLADEENTFELLRFVPTLYEKTLVEAIRELLSIPKKERNHLIVRELKQLISADRVHPLGEIQSGWFLEILKNEKPQTMGLILRYLPGDKVRYILDQLSPEVRKRLPKMNEAHKIPELLIEVIRGRFESQFLTFVPPRRSEGIHLHHLYFIKVEQLLSFFRDLGVEQLACAFQGVHKTVWKALLTRLSIKDAKELQARVKSLEKVSKRELAEAQMLLLDLPLEAIEPQELFLEVGLAFFARAITKEELDFVRALQFKLPPKLGYLLKRYVDGSLVSQKPSVTEWVKKRVLDRFQSFPLN